MRKGFTLVELSIVLVIVGLLIGGILVGQSMIETAKIQAQIRQLQQFDIAVTNFKTKFGQIPGDTTLSNHAFGTEGDGIIDQGVSPPGVYSEAYYIFPDLYLMGCIKDQYQGQGGTYEIGITHQYPAAAIGRGGMAATGTSDGSIFYFTIFQGAVDPNDNYPYLMAQGVLSAAEALAIDVKVDDGNPATGGVAAVTPNIAPNLSALPFILDTTTCASGGVYNASQTGNNLCNIVVKSNFQ